MPFLLLWSILPFFWYYLLKFAGLGLSKLNIMTFVIIVIIIYQYLGLPILYFKLDPFRTDNVSDTNLVFKVFIFTSLTLTLLILGFILGRFFFGKNRSIKIHYLNYYFKITPLIILTIFCIIILFLYISKLGLQNIALFAAFNFIPDNNLGVLRSNMGNSFDGKYHWYYLFMNQLLKLCVFIFYSLFLLNPIKSNRYYFFISLLFLIISLTLATEKGPLVNLIISLFLIFVILKNNSSYPFKYFIPIAFLITIILCFFYFKFMGATSTQQAILAILSRTLTGQIEPVYNYLQFFPNVHDYLYGRSMSNPMNIFPFEYYNLSQEIMKWYFPDQNNAGIVGSMPTIFWGELYANFGIFGVLIFPSFVGFFLYGFNKFILNNRFSAILIGTYVWFILYFSNLASTSLSSYFFDIYPIIIYITFTVLSFASFYKRSS